MTILGTPGDDNLSGTTGDDTFELQQGGHDTADGLAGDDTFYMRKRFDALDSIDGGADKDRVFLKGDYSSGVVFGAATMTNIETLRLGGAYDYNLTTHDATVAAGARLTVNAKTLDAAHSVTFDGSAEANGRFTIFAGAGNDTLTGGAKGDTFNLALGGNDTANGGAGRDTFSIGGTFGTSDAIDGGDDNDTVFIAGNYSGGNALIFTATTMVNVETLVLGNNAYDITIADETVAAGATLTVDASALGDFLSAHKITFDGSAETDGFLHVIGGQASDTFKMGANMKAADIIDGGIESLAYISSNINNLYLDGDYSGANALVFTSTTLHLISGIGLTAGHDYDITTHDDNVAAGKTMGIDASTFGASNELIFDGSAETDGKFTVSCGDGDDIVTGGAGNDTILSWSGDNQAYGGAGDDLIVFNNGLTAGDIIDGGADNDQVNASGTTDIVLVFSATTMTNVEKLQLAFNNFDLTSHDATVAAGATMTVDATMMTGGFNTVVFDGSAETDGSFDFIGGPADVTLTGGALADTFDLSQGGTDLAYGGGGNDTFDMGAAFTTDDAIDGGAGTADTVNLDGDYSTTVTFSNATMKNVEVINLAAGNDYSLTLSFNTVASGETLTIDGTALGAGDGFSFDTFGDATQNLTLKGGAGDDFFLMLGTFHAADKIDGGTGNDYAYLSGDYSAGVTFNADTMTNIDAIFLQSNGSSYSYNLTTNDGNVTAGQTLGLGGGGLTATESVTFDGSAETDGAFSIFTGSGADTLTGGGGADSMTAGAGDDTLTGGAGADSLTGGAGGDTFVYAAVSESTSVNRDTIVGFTTAQDQFDLNVTVTLIETAITGDISAASFDTDLGSAVNDGGLNANHAMIVTATGGDLIGHVFLVVDGDAATGYTGGADFVFDITGYTGTLATGNFI